VKNRVGVVNQFLINTGFGLQENLFQAIHWQGGYCVDIDFIAAGGMNV